MRNRHERVTKILHRLTIERGIRSICEIRRERIDREFQLLDRPLANHSAKNVRRRKHRGRYGRAGPDRSQARFKLLKRRLVLRGIRPARVRIGELAQRSLERQDARLREITI